MNINKSKSTYHNDPLKEEIPARHSRLLGVSLIVLALLSVVIQIDTESIDITAAIVIGFIGMAEFLPSVD